MSKTLKIIFIGVIFLTIPFFANAIYTGQEDNFFVDSTYDLSQRSQITATLQRISLKGYFYIDNDWWNTLNYSRKNEVKLALDSLVTEFDYKIYPILTSNFGFEWKPGIDDDRHITILIHPMVKEAGGYFNNGDEYPRAQNPKSNEREMIYLNTDYITEPISKSYLAHEFTHLITFNQKNKKYGVEEETWLNEARAEYAPTLVGYDDVYDGSNLERRVKKFLEKPSDSITEWQNASADYGGLNLFTQYLVEQYGIEVLVDSLKSKEAGIKSLNKALEKNDFDIDFSQIFTDWTITVLANDCSLGEKYCYENKNLKNLRIIPSINFLPLKGKSTLGVSQTTKNWSGNWFKFIGGKKGTLKIEFIGNPENLFKVPYFSKNISGESSLNFFKLNEYQRGEILVSGFGTDISSVTIIPTIQSKVSGFSDQESAFPFFWEASTIAEAEEVEEGTNSKYLEKPISKMSQQEILAMISEIEELLQQLKNRFAQIELEEEIKEVSCQKFEENLFYGLRNDDRVYCLQQFLKDQGSEIYPEGLVTGNFLNLTRAAAIRFQEKYADEILAPLELSAGTGFVGSLTRAKINTMMKY